jgi:hypothetical protein
MTRDRITSAMLAACVNDFFDLGPQAAKEHLISLDTPERPLNRLKIRTSWICRLLYFPHGAANHLRGPFLGEVGLPYRSMPVCHWPLFPLALSNGVPFVLGDKYVLCGKAEPIEHYVNYCVEFGQFRTEPIPVPTRNIALDAADALVTSDRWKDISWCFESEFENYIYSEEHTVEFIRAQADRCLDQN